MYWTQKFGHPGLEDFPASCLPAKYKKIACQGESEVQDSLFVFFQALNVNHKFLVVLGCIHRLLIFGLCFFRDTFLAGHRHHMQVMALQSLLHFSGSSDHMDTVSLSAAGGLAKEGIACGPVSTIKVTRCYKSIYMYSGFVPQYQKVLYKYACWTGYFYRRNAHFLLFELLHWVSSLSNFMFFASSVKFCLWQFLTFSTSEVLVPAS